MDTHSAINGFREEVALTQQNDQLAHVFVEEGRKARRALYSEPHAIGDFDVARVEKEYLRKALYIYRESIKGKASKENLRFLESCEDFTTLNQRLIDARHGWSEKKRLFGGKGQEVFHKLCRTMQGHQTILDAFPSSNEYVSVFCAAFNTVVQASLNHQQTAERLLVDLQRINEAIEMVSASVALFNIETTRVKFANLYGHVFHFFLEAVRWYGSSTRFKMLKSINAKYYDAFEDQVNTILTLKSEVAERSSLGSMAEVREIRETVQAIDGDWQAVRQLLKQHQIGAEGQARQIAEQNAYNHELQRENAAYQKLVTELSNGKSSSLLRIAATADRGILDLTRAQISQGLSTLLESMIEQKSNGTLQLTLPESQAVTIKEALTSADPERELGRKRNMYDRERLLAQTECFDGYVYSPASTESLLGDPGALALPNIMFARIKEWIASSNSELLWVVGPTEHRYPSKMSAVASTVIRLIAQSKPLVIFHFCELPQLEDHHGRSDEEVGIINMVYSMIQQLVYRVESQLNTDIDFGAQRFARLDGTLDTLDLALDLFRDLTCVCLPYIIFVVDGMERLDYSRGTQGCEDFLNLLRELASDSQTENITQRVCKVLFTSAATSGTLMSELDVGEILLQDGRKGSLRVDRVSLGGTSVGELEDYD